MQANNRIENWPTPAAVVLFLLMWGIAGPTPAQTPYLGDGTPTGLEEEIRWRVNRGRFDSASENLARGTAFSDVPATAGPLAPNQCLILAARHQSEDMAKQNVFQHATVPGSAYYDPVTQPNPWDRMRAEGYAWNYAGENIAAGYPTAEAAYVGWWNSTGHRENMFNSAFREIGNGYYYWTASSYRSYYTMDLGNSANHCFFTDTLFFDADGKGMYDQGEGIAGIATILWVGGKPIGNYDVSSEPGSFAIPIETISSGATVQLVLSNTTGVAISLTIPRSYHNYTKVTLAAGQSWTAGSFLQGSSGRNLGLRDLRAQAAGLVCPRLMVTPLPAGLCLTWPTEIGQQYQPQWTTNFLEWNDLSPAQPGTGAAATCLDNQAPDSTQKFYRLLVRQP